ncbi:MAG: HNH endonuclease [Oscillospiraceae bacterium]|nr:HNH endonuclease [Oscillospiraceae bacterium]
MEKTNYKVPSYERFDKRLKDLWDLIGKEQPQLGYKGKVSFHNPDGWIYDTETGYKEELIENNNKVLRPLQPLYEDTDALREAVKLCFNHTQYVVKGNLISFAAYDYAANRIDSDPISGNIIRDVLMSSGDNEREAFESAKMFFGKRYDVVSYLFMLKDPQNYFSIRSDEAYGSKLGFLGFNSSCVSECSWESYQEYIWDLHYIKEKLQDYFTENITLVDAESFMWMMYKLIGNKKYESYEYKSKEPDPNDPYENHVTGMEGNRNGYYVARFERNPRLRNAAAKRDNYTCRACGMQFVTKYGDYGKNYIEVHHTVPLSTYDEQRDTPIDELVSVCSNCHSIIHRKKNYVLTIEELKEILQSSESKPEAENEMS